MAATLAAIAFLVLLDRPAQAREYARAYSFAADRSECDGQCTYCRHAHNHAHWAEIRKKISRYVYQPNDGGHSVPLAVGVRHMDVQGMIDYSWDREQKYECVIGIISMRLLSYAYADPMGFVEEKGNDFSVLDFLDRFNQHTGALDLLQSAWAAMLAGGWPIFKEFWLVSRKVRDRLLDEGAYPKLQERANECDELNSAEDVAYRDSLIGALKGERPWPLAGAHFTALYRGIGCPAGAATAMLSLALDLVRNRFMYQGSLKSVDNLVYALVSTAQDAVNLWARSKLNWSPFFDLLTTDWPIWEVLSALACVDSGRPCVTRSSWRCYDMVRRRDVECPHAPALLSETFAACGEHDVCSRPPDLDPGTWCVPWDRRAPTPREPWLLTLNHDAEQRVCAQCGQDGVIREIFSRIGFRDEAGPGQPPFFVEFGARKPGMLNSAALRELCHWDGLLMDSQPGETPHGGCRDCPGVAELVRTEFVTADNVVELFKKYNVPRDFDLLTIDTDYNDYWLWRAVLADGSFRPRVVAVDFNPDIPLDQAKVVEYEAMAEWDGSVYTVGSLLAYSLMAHAHGYSFAYALEMGAHAFFVRGDLLAEADLNLPLRAVRKDSHLPDEKGRAFVDVLYDFPPPGVNWLRNVSASAPAAGQSPKASAERTAAAKAAGFKAAPTSAATAFYDRVRERRGDV